MLRHTLPLATQLEDLSRLKESAGWRLFDEQFELMEKIAFDAMCKAKTGEEVLEHRARWQVIKDVRSWPERYAREVRVFIEATQAARVKP